MVKRYNIVIIPTPAVNHDAEFVSQFIAGKQETCFVLDHATQFPHISLYHVYLDETSVKEVADTVQRIAKSFSPFTVESTGYHTVKGEWIDVSYTLDEPLFKLHTAFLEAVAPFRVRQKDTVMREDWSDSSPARQENLERYGWSEARDLFCPHLTLTRLKGQVDTDFLETFPEKNFSFEVNKIGFYELGEHGTCTKLLVEYTLSPLNI